MGKVYQQGDVYIEAIASIPSGKKINRKNGKIVLAEGERTGHAHVIVAPKIKWIEANDKRYLDASTGFTVQHEEHGTIDLPAGQYRVWQQREYHPSAIRTVRD